MLKKFEDILTQCIEDVKAGRSSIDDCLARYPSVSKQLEPLLRIALEIQGPPDVKPSASFKSRARVQLMEQIHARQAVTRWPWLRYIKEVKQIQYKRRFSMVSIIVALVLAVSALGGGTAYASQSSLPGDVLYPVKLGTENIRLAFAGADADKAELCLEFASSRVEEMTALVGKRRPDKVDIAVNGYDDAMAMAMEKMEDAQGKGLGTASTSEGVAEATLKHQEILDGLLGTVPDEARPGIEKAIAASKTGYENSLLALAGENPVRAIEINLAAMTGMLNRAKAEAEENDVEGVETALADVEELRQFGEEISEIARGLGEGTSTIDELVTRATAIHLEVLAEVLEKIEGLENVPDEAKQAIGRAMEESAAGYQRAIEALERAGASGNIPEELPIPEGLPDEVEEKLEEVIPPRPEVPTGSRP